MKLSMRGYGRKIKMVFDFDLIKTIDCGVIKIFHFHKFKGVFVVVVFFSFQFVNSILTLYYNLQMVKIF